MATYTKNLNLKKPHQDDYHTIDDFNGNMEIIDKIVGVSEDNGESELANLLIRTATLENDLKSVNTGISSLTTNLSTANSEISTLKTKIETLESKVSELENS